MLRILASNERELLKAVARVQHGDSNAFAVIYHHYICEVQERCRRRLCWLDRKRGYEEDLANEVMVSLWRSLIANDQDSLTLDLLRCILGRLIFEHCVNRGKYNKRRKRSLEGEQYIVSLDLQQDQVARTEVAEVEVMDFLQFVLLAISDRESRTVVSLRIRGFSNMQIAQKCRISPRTVRRKLHAAWRTIENQVAN